MFLSFELYNLGATRPRERVMQINKNIMADDCAGCT